MIVGVGTDLVEIDRLGKAMKRTPSLRERLFTPAEAVLGLDSLAARFAAKEALVKALGAPGGLSWHDAEVVIGEGGLPVLRMSGTVAARAAVLDADRVHLSLSHDGGFALAYVVLESAAKFP